MVYNGFMTNKDEYYLMDPNAMYKAEFNEKNIIDEMVQRASDIIGEKKSDESITKCNECKALIIEKDNYAHQYWHESFWDSMYGKK